MPTSTRRRGLVARLMMRLPGILAGFLATAALALAFHCNGNDKPELAGPVLTSFTADRTVLTVGKSAALTAVYRNGLAEVWALPAAALPGTPPAYVGPVPGSGVALTVAPAETTVYTLVVSEVLDGKKLAVTAPALTVKVVAPPDKPVITVKADSVGPNQVYTASVPEQEDCTYLWSIANGGGGTLTDGTTTSTVTFRTAGFGKLVLRCTVTNAAGDSESGEHDPLLLGGPTVVSFAAGTGTQTTDSSSGEPLYVTDSVQISLTFVIQGGTGAIDQAPAGGGPGVRIADGLSQFQHAFQVTPPPDAATVYTLSVTDPLIGTSSERLTVSTMAKPVVTRFRTVPSPAILGPGLAAELEARFDADPAAAARVDPLVGSVAEGIHGSGTVEQTTTFELTVVNGEGAHDPQAPAGRTTATATATVLVGSLARLAGVPSGQGSSDAGRGQYVAPAGAAVDADGNIYVADPDLHVIRRVDADGTVWNVAGVEGEPGRADGLDTDARFNRPTGLALDRDTGLLYVADAGNHAIRVVRVTALGGQVATFAGTPGRAGASDSAAAGSTAGAAFNGPEGIAWGRIGADANLFVADTGNATLRRILLAGGSGTVSTISGAAGAAGNRSGADARYDHPSGVAWSNGWIYVADSGNNRVRAVTFDAGAGAWVADPAPALALNPSGTAGSAVGAPNGAAFDHPRGVAATTDGRLFVADTGNHALRLVDLLHGNQVSTLAGNPGQPGTGDGSDARFERPQGVAVNPGNDLLAVADTGNALVRTLPVGAGAAVDVTTVSGEPPVRGAEDGDGADARMRRPRGAALLPDGGLVLADSGNHTLRRVAPDGTVSTLAGEAGTAGFRDSAGGPPLFREPSAVAVAVDPADSTLYSIYVADTGNHALRRVTPDGQVQTVAGDGTAGAANSSAPGSAAGARFDRPMGIALDGHGRLVVADTGNHAIRLVDPAEGYQVGTLAGDPGQAGADDGPGLGGARFDGPEAVAVNPGSGVVYVADTGNHLVRAIDPGGAHDVTTIAGQAGVGGSRDGTGTGARLDLPAALALDKDGNLFVANRGSSTLCTINPDGQVNTFLGDPEISGVQDLLRSPGSTGAEPLPARLAPPRGLVVDADPGHAFTEFICVVVDDAVLKVDFRQ